MLSELDRCFRYGDGLFETILFVDQEPVLFDEHIHRLTRGVERLGLNYVVDLSQLLERCRQTIGVSSVVDPAGRCVVRIQLSRGEGGRGYAPPSPPLAVREYISDHAFPAIPESLSVRLLDTRLMMSQMLCDIKHCSRVEQVLAANELMASNKHDTDICWEGLMLDELGFLAEGTRTNIIIESNGRLLTPLLDRSGLGSTLLAALLKSAEFGSDCSTVRMRFGVPGALDVLDCSHNDQWLAADLMPAAAWQPAPLDGMALCNSVIGIRVVEAYAGLRLSNTGLVEFAKKANVILGYT